MQSTTFWWLSLVLGLWLTVTQATPRPPNFLLIVADDLGVGDLSSTGSFTIKTPNIDQLVSQGVSFTQFYGQPLCSPSRASMFTGRLPIRGGVYTNIPFPGNTAVFYPPSSGCLLLNETLIPQYLKNFNSDYWAGMVGKWHLGHNPDLGCLPTRRGFDSFIGVPYSHEESWPLLIGNAAFPSPPLPLYNNETIVEQPVTLTDLPGLYRDKILSDLDWLGSTHRPFFYHYSFDQPHYPVFASKPYQNQSLRGLYGDAVQEIDASVGLVMAKLQSNPFLHNNTIVCFISDNGAWVTPSNGLNLLLTYPLQGGANQGLRDQKGSTWEGGMRILGTFWYPSKISPASSTAVASVHDILPTFLDFAGISLPTDRAFDGFSLVPILTAKNQTSPTTFIHYWKENTLYAIRWGPFKCHWTTQSGFGVVPPVHYDPCLLFHLEWNPFETVPLNGTDCAGIFNAATCDDIIAVMNAEYTNHVATTFRGPAEEDLINPIYAPCCHGVVTTAAMTAAAALGLTQAQLAFWQFLNCTC